MYKLASITVTAFFAGCTPQPKQQFSQFAEEFVYTALANSPVAATQAGYHRHGGVQLDAALDDYSGSSIERQRRWYQDFRVRLMRSADGTRLSPDDLADYEIMQAQISLALLEIDEIQSYRYNPTLYVELIGNALYSPFTLNYADSSTRFEHIVSRMERVPDLLAQARRNLISAPDIWTRVAIEENEGNASLIDKTLRNAAPTHLRTRFDHAAERALKAIREFNDYLRDDLSRRTRDWRLGSDLYAKRFRYVLGTDRSPQQVLADAEHQLEATRRLMHRNAGKVLNDISSPFPQSITLALDKVAAKHATPETYFADARRDLEELRQFVKASNLVALPARDNLQVIETPEFMRGIYSVGGFGAAPPLEPHLGAFYWLTPIPQTWPKERVESKLREYNFYGLKLLTIHEAMPGHYVQFEYANDVEPAFRRILRAVFGNGPYIEGWGVLATETVVQNNYLNGAPEMSLTFQKHLLRVIANTILDIRMHTRGMSDQDALALMIRDTFQEKEEAEAKLQRAKLSSVQLPTYFVGWRDWQRLRARYAAERGDTYSPREFNERVLRAGAVPLPFLSYLLTGKRL